MVEIIQQFITGNEKHSTLLQLTLQGILCCRQYAERQMLLKQGRCLNNSPVEDNVQSAQVANTASGQTKIVKSLSDAIQQGTRLSSRHFQTSCPSLKSLGQNATWPSMA